MAGGDRPANGVGAKAMGSGLRTRPPAPTDTGDYSDPPGWGHRRYWVKSIRRWDKVSDLPVLLVVQRRSSDHLAKVNKNMLLN